MCGLLVDHLLCSCWVRGLSRHLSNRWVLLGLNISLRIAPNTEPRTWLISLFVRALRFIYLLIQIISQAQLVRFLLRLNLGSSLHERRFLTHLQVVRSRGKYRKLRKLRLTCIDCSLAGLGLAVGRRVGHRMKIAELTACLLNIRGRVSVAMMLV